MEKPIDLSKLKELIKYISSKSSEDIFFGRVKLFKLVFFADFNAYRRTGQTITGESYHKEPNGPVSNHIRKAFKELLRDGEMEEMKCDIFGRNQFKPICKNYPDLNPFSKEEIISIEDVVDSYKSLTGAQISELSHDSIPAWENRENGEDIPVSLSLMAPVEEEEELTAIGLDVLDKLNRNEIDTNAFSSPV